MEILKILLKLKSSINLNEYLFFKREKNNKWISNKDYDVVYLQNEEDVDLSITAIKKDIPYILLMKYRLLLNYGKNMLKLKKEIIELNLKKMLLRISLINTIKKVKM